MRPRDAFGQSTWYALRALELDDSLADTHALLAMLRKELDYNWPEVDREMAHARRLNRDSPAVQVRSAVSGLLPHGRLDEALAEIDRALDRDPLSVFVRWWSAAIAYLARRPERMTDEGRRIVALENHHPFGHWALGMALVLHGEPEAAVPRLEQAARLSGDASFFLGFQALAQGLAGDHRAARATIARLERPAAERYIQPGAVALAHIGLGEWDEAFLRMEAAIDERDPLVIPIKSFHFMDQVRDDPRYLALLRSMNMPV
jgi:predicted Zn-dependent protease